MPLDFWAAKESWYSTWKPSVANEELAAMKVDYIKVWALLPINQMHQHFKFYEEKLSD